MRKSYLTPEVAPNFIDVYNKNPLVTNFKRQLESNLESVAPLKIKKLKRKPMQPQRNVKIRQLKRNGRTAERRWRKNKLLINYSTRTI